MPNQKKKSPFAKDIFQKHAQEQAQEKQVIIHEKKVDLKDVDGLLPDFPHGATYRVHRQLISPLTVLLDTPIILVTAGYQCLDICTMWRRNKRLTN